MTAPAPVVPSSSLAPLVVLNDLARLVNVERDLDRVLQTFIERARDLIGARQAALRLTWFQGGVRAYHALSPSSAPRSKIDNGLSGLDPFVCQNNTVLRLTRAELETHQAWQAGQVPVQGWLGVPLTAHDGSNLGLLQLSDKLEAEFTAEDELCLAQIAHLASLAIELSQLSVATSQARQATETLTSDNERLVRAEQQSRQIAETLRVANLALTQNLHLDDVLETLLDYLSWLVPYDSASIMLRTGETNLVVRAARNYTSAVTPLTNLAFKAESNEVLYDLLMSRKSALIPDLHDQFGDEKIIGFENGRSWLGVPLMSDREVIGLYSLGKGDPHFFTEAHQHIAEVLAAQAVVAIQNARLYEETIHAKEQLEGWARTLEQRVEERTTELRQANAVMARRAVQLETTSQIGQQVTSILELDELLTQIVQFVQAIFGYYFVGIWLVPEQKDFVVLQAGTSRRGETLRDLQIPLNAASIIAGVCRTGQLRAAEDVAQLKDFLAISVIPDTRSELTLPLRMGDKIFGALDIQQDQITEFGSDDRVVLQILADQLSVAIRNAQLYKTEQHRRHLAEALEQAGRELSGSLDMSQVPGLILEQLAVVVPYERGLVLLRQGDEMLVMAQRGFTGVAPTLGVKFLLDPLGVFQQLTNARRPLIFSDIAQTVSWPFSAWQPINRAGVGVPLISQDKVMGMLILTRRDKDTFTMQDATLASAFSGQAAIALENAGLYAEIKQFNEQLEQKVQLRTEELNRAYQTLERLDKTKTSFIEVAAHELRTPLTVIKGYTQVLGMIPGVDKDPQGKAMLDGILNGTNRLHEVVNSMLDVTKIANQTLQLRKDRVWLNHIIGKVQAGFKEALVERNLTVVSEHLDDLPALHADGDLLHKVFYHVIVNAIKYTPDGGQITVSGQVLDDTKTIEVLVADSGIGIDHQHHELIFEKFYQTGEVAVHSSGRTKFKGGGPGLGLAIARGIIDAHRGKIWVESLGHDEQRMPGSRFFIHLPIEA